MPRNPILSNIRDFTEENMSAQVVWDTDEAQEEYLKTSRELVILREQKKRLEEREGELKKVLMKVLEGSGEPYGPDGQHRTIAFPRAIRGISGFVRQTKVSTTVDSVKAEAIARHKGIYDRLFKPVPTLDQDAVMVALAEHLLTDDDLEEIFPKSVSYALVAEKAKK